MLASIHAGEFFAALLFFDFKVFFKFIDTLNILVGADNILKVLKKAGLILVLSFGFHKRDLFNLTLQDEKPVMLQVDALGTEKLADLFE